MSRAIVNDMAAVDDTKADDYGLALNQVVEVVGFHSQNGTLYAVVVADGYRSLPAWYLTPIPTPPPVPGR